MTPRQLIICCDGTNNNLTGRVNDTNVTQLCELLAPDSHDQILFYDPGVGNPGELPGTTWADSIGRRVERLYGLAFGKGIYENIAEAYAFLMRHYREGDQIFLYGFSRGAFTARSIGGLVTMFGLLRPDMTPLIPTLLHTYFADRRESTRHKDIARQISELFCSGATREVPVWFIGVWDTVASVGFPLLSSKTITARPSIKGKRVHHVRQALALDDHRRSFEPRPYIIETDHDYAAAGQSIAQQWFVGSHCDVGGGYETAETRLSQEALLWMVQESVACGLRLPHTLLTHEGTVDEARVRSHLAPPSSPTEAPPPPPSVVLHSETYTTPWWTLGGLKVRDPQANPDWDAQGAPVDAQAHPSVAAHALRFPQDTVWRRRRPAAPWFAALLAGLVLWVLAGGFLNPATAMQLDTRDTAALISSTTQALCHVTTANFDLASWQLTRTPWDPPAGWPCIRQAHADGPVFTHLRTALVLDLGLIVCYGYLLARLCSRAFARVAGLGAVTRRPSPVLNFLGLLPGLALGADVVEDLTTWLWSQWADNSYAPMLTGLSGWAMSTASLAKWLALLGCFALVVWGWVASVGRARK